MQSTKKIAILFFSRKVAQESKFKTFVPDNAKKNEDFSRILITKAEKALSSTELPIFHFHEGNQKGKTFGERLANAYQEIFDLGYKSVVAVGNDSLDIANVNWLSIANQLAAGKSVLGPTLRGGTYLIGITKTLFNKKAFAALPWQSRKLFKSLKASLTLSGEVISLQQGRDINTFIDVKAMLHSTKEVLDTAFARLIKWILNLKSELKIKHGLEIITCPLLIYSPFRGPPALPQSR